MTRRGWVLFAAMGVIWGIPYLLIKVAVAHLGPASLVLCRTGIGALLLLPVAIGRGELAPVLRRWRWLAAYTAAELAVPWLLLSSAEQSLPSSLTGLLVAAVPLVGAVVALFLPYRERLGAPAVAGMVVGLGGVALLAGVDVRGDWVALGEVAVVTIGYATGPLILARRLSDLPAVGVVASSLALCAVAYVPAGITGLPAHLPPARVLAAVAVLGAVCTAVAFLLFFALIAETGPLRATVITYVNPLVAVALGAAFLGERVGAATAGGAALILAGSALATGRVRLGRRGNPEPESQPVASP